MRRHPASGRPDAIRVAVGAQSRRERSPQRSSPGAKPPRPPMSIMVFAFSGCGAAAPARRPGRNAAASVPCILTRRRRRRGGGIALVILVLFALLVLASTALALVAATATVVEREYRGSQALALAEAGLAAATARVGRGGAAELGGSQRFEEGQNRWQATRRGGRWAVAATGTVVTPRGITLERTVRADLVRRSGRWTITHWREERER